MAAFPHQVQIEVGEEKRECVRVEGFEWFAVMRAALNFIASRFRRGLLVGGPNGFEKAFPAEFYGIGDFCRRVRRIFENDTGFRGPREEKTNGPTVRDSMRSEQPEGVGIAPGEKRVDAGVRIRDSLLFRGSRWQRDRFEIFGRQS